MKRILFSFTFVLLSYLCFAQGYSLKFVRVIDTTIILDVPCCSDIFNSPATIDLNFIGLTKITSVSNLNKQVMVFVGCTSNPSGANNGTFERYWLNNGDEALIPSEFNGAAWKKAGSGIRLKVYSRSANQNYLCWPGQTFPFFKEYVNITGIEFIKVP